MSAEKQNSTKSRSYGHSIDLKSVWENKRRMNTKSKRNKKLTKIVLIGLICWVSSASASEMSCMGGGDYATSVFFRFDSDRQIANSISIVRATGPRTPGIKVLNETVNLKSTEPFELESSNRDFQIIEAKPIITTSSDRSFYAILILKTIGETSAEARIICRIQF